MQGTRVLQVMFLSLLFSLVLAVPSLAQAPTDNVLSNADIVRMERAGIPESLILREIQMSETDFAIGASALIELKNQGVSDRVLEAILDSKSANNGSYAQGLPPTRAAQQPPPPLPHHLPSFDAAVRFDSKTTGKISVGQNHIRVERSGVPVFSLKWQDKPSR